MKWKINDVSLEQNPIQSGLNPQNEFSFEEVVDGSIIISSPLGSFVEEISATWMAASIHLRNLLFDIFSTDKKVTLVTHTGLEGYVVIDQYSESERSGKRASDGSSAFDIDVVFRVVDGGFDEVEN